MTTLASAFIMYLIYPILVLVFQDNIERDYPIFLKRFIYVVAVICFVLTLPVSILTCGIVYYIRKR